MTKDGYPSRAVKIVPIVLVLLGAIVVLSQAVGPEWLPPWKSFQSSNDFLAGGTPLNGGVLVTSPSQSGMDAAGYVSRARLIDDSWPLGNFQEPATMNEFRHGAGSVIARGPDPGETAPGDSISYLYIVGGVDGIPLSTIERVEIRADGTFAPGTMTTAGELTTPRYGATVVTRANYIYVIGGYDGNDAPLNTIEHLRISASGQLDGPALEMTETARGGDVAAAIVNGYLYVMGGTTGERGPTEAVQNSFQRAEILPYGDLGPFEDVHTTAAPGQPLLMPVGVAGGRAVVVAGWESDRPVYSLYYLGGNVGDGSNGASREVYRLKIHDDNTVPAAWAELPLGSGSIELVDRRELFAAVVTNGHIYVIGGETTKGGETTYYSSVERAPVGANGDITGPFTRLEGTQTTFINEMEQATDISGTVLNNHIYVPGGRDRWDNPLDHIFTLSLDQEDGGNHSLLGDPVPDASVYGLVSDLGTDTKIHSIAFDVGPDQAAAKDIRVRFRTAESDVPGWGAWTPYFEIASLPRDYDAIPAIAGEVPFLLDLTYTPGAGSCQDSALVPNPTDRMGPLTARYMEYQVIIPEGSADQKLHRLEMEPRPIPHFALPGGFDPRVTGGPYPPSCAPGNAIADQGTQGWVRFKGVGFDFPTLDLDATSLRFASTGTLIPVDVLSVDYNASTLNVKVGIGGDESDTAPHEYALVYDPLPGTVKPVTLLNPAITVYPAPKLENSLTVPGLDVHPGTGLDRENVVEAPKPGDVRKRFPLSLFGDHLRSGRINDTDALAVDDPDGTGIWPSNPDSRASSQVEVLNYKLVDVTPGATGDKALNVWDATPGAWQTLPRGDLKGPQSFVFDLEVNNKAKSGPHDLQITVRNPQLGGIYNVTQTVYVIPAFDVMSMSNMEDPDPDPSPGSGNDYDWTGSYNPAVADLGDGVTTAGGLAIRAQGYGFRSDSGNSLITGVSPVPNGYYPSVGAFTVNGADKFDFTAMVPTNTTPMLHNFGVEWAYTLGVSDPAGHVAPVWGDPSSLTLSRSWPTAGTDLWIGLYVVPPRVNIQSILGTHNTNDPIVVLQSDPTLTVNGAGFATHGPGAGGFVSTLHQVRLISMVNSPDEDVFPMASGTHMVSDRQARLSMDLPNTQRPGQAYMLEMQTSLPTLEAHPGSKVRHPYSTDQSASLVTVLPLPGCQDVTVASSCLRADQGGRLIGVVVSGSNFDMGSTIDLGPGITIENLVVCNDDPTCVPETITFDAVVSPYAAPGSRLVQIENGPTNAIPARTSCASPTFDFWVVPRPDITSIHPSTIQQPPMATGSRMVPIDVYGMNFIDGADITVTLASGTYDVTVVPGSVVVVGSGHITAELIVPHNAPEGDYMVTVKEPSGPTCGTEFMTAEHGIGISAFREISITGVTQGTAGNPSQCQGRSGTLEVSGNNFTDPSGIELVGNVSLGPDVSIVSMVIASATEMTIRYTINDGAGLGMRPLVMAPVTQGAMTATWPDALKVTSSPSITSVSPSSILSGTTRQITISGRNFYEGGATVEVISPATGVHVDNTPGVVNSGQILVTLTLDELMQPDPISILVTNADGGACAVATMNAAIQIVDAPHVTSYKYKKKKVKIFGTNFHPSLQAYVDGSATPWPKIKVKKNSKVVLKKVHHVIAPGETVEIRLVNPDDGGETTIEVTRPLKKK